MGLKNYLSQNNHKRLINIENKVLLRTFVVVNEGQIWIIRKTNELREVYKEADIVSIIKSKRIRWLLGLT